jgi:hypothetical protein
LDTEWAVMLISRITNDEDIAIESNVVVKQVRFALVAVAYEHPLLGITVIILFTLMKSLNTASRPSDQRREILFWNKEKSC